MAEERKTKSQKKWVQKLRNKYRLVILNDETYEERLSFRLSRLNVFLFLGILSIILVLLTTIIIAFTPLREYIPGYMDPKLPKQVYLLQRKADSLESSLRGRDIYFKTIKNIIEGNDFYDTVVDIPGETRTYDSIELESSKADSEFRLDYEQQNEFNLYLYENENLAYSPTFSNINFFSPLKGEITNYFNLAEKHYGIDIVSGKNEAVKATLDGTVILADWSVKTGYVMVLQHRGNFISVYMHNSVLLKKAGNFVRAGEPIAIVGETGELSTGPHLHFELWYNGGPVNPRDYLAFN